MSDSKFNPTVAGIDKLPILLNRYVRHLYVPEKDTKEFNFISQQKMEKNLYHETKISEFRNP